LAAVRVVVEVPDREARRPGLHGRLRIGRFGEHVVTVHGAVLRPERRTLPEGLEHAVHGAGLVAGVGLDRSPPPGGPAHDPDLDIVRIVEGVAVAVERLGRPLHERNLDQVDAAAIAASHGG